MFFSVLIPAYKKAFLQEAIESVLMQTFSDFELVIVNDCSPEDLDGVVDLFEDERIKYHKNSKNCGAKDVVDNWNKCLGFAKGDYVICMGDDDRLLPNCLSDYSKGIQKHPDFNIYHIRTEVINENGDIVDLQESRPMFETTYSMLWHRLVRNRIQYIGDFLFKKEWLIRQGGFYKLPYACYSDDITAYLAAKEKGIVNINVSGFQYRNNSQTITNTQDLKLVVSSVQQAIKWMREFLQFVPDSRESCLYRDLVIKMLNGYESNMYRYCFRTDMEQHPLKKMSFWWKHRVIYQIPKRYYLRVLFDAIKGG
jgi:glycosyltransferase involved in cell wall biosynthesis